MKKKPLKVEVPDILFKEHIAKDVKGKEFFKMLDQMFSEVYRILNEIRKELYEKE